MVDYSSSVNNQKLILKQQRGGTFKGIRLVLYLEVIEYHGGEF
jgi:hypothetical protein